jgi:hypothetical protein
MRLITGLSGDGRRAEELALRQLTNAPMARLASEHRLIRGGDDIMKVSTRRHSGLPNEELCEVSRHYRFLGSM